MWEDGRMRSISFINPVVRATVVIGAVAALVTGVTFAALQSQATLTDNTIASATAALQVNNTDDATNGLGSTDVGFAFSDLLPGADYGPAKHFSLKNNGTADLKVTVKATGTTTTGTIDKAKVHIKFTNTDTSTSAEYTM